MTVDTSLSNRDLEIMRRIMNGDGVSETVEVRSNEVISDETIRLIGLGYVSYSKHPFSSEGNILRITAIGRGKYLNALDERRERVYLCRGAA